MNAHPQHDPNAPAPEGFVPVQLGGDFVTHNGQLYARWFDSRLQLGLRVQRHQVNPGQSCHGGMLATLADILLSGAAHYQTDIPRQFLPTISLQIDYIAAAPLGCWVQGQADIGTVYRLQAVTESEGEASSLCAAMKTHGLACQVRK